MKFGSLFAGIGGLDLGLERAGMECAWQVEWDDYCQRVLAKHWPAVRRYGDVRECGAHNLEAVDLVCGGFPCQPVSQAGKRKGEADPRWLWPEFHRIIREIRPRWVLVENVPGLLSIDSGRLMAGILRDLAESGYDAEWDCIPAAAVGAPHLRYRVFIVAYYQRMGREERAKCQALRPHKPSTERQKLDELCEVVADASGGQSRESQSWNWRQDSGRGSQAVADTERHDVEGPQHVFTGQRIEPRSWWAAEPCVGRVAHGVPHRVDRLRALGNAVVPQVAEWLGNQIVEFDG